MAATARALGTAYLLEEPIGSGATGEVWRARRRDGGSPVAVKILRPDLARDPEVVARFVRERTIVVSVQHPHLVAVHDLVAEGGTLAIVMDLVDGGDLRRRLAASGPLPPGELCRLLAQVARGLEAIHAAGIVHRDVKPENVLVDRAGGRARISDFGIAWTGDGVALTGGGPNPGTGAYLAPEVIEGATAGPPADVYAAGVMAYELACGRRPFVADSALAVLRMHVDTPPVRPTGVPAPLWAVIARCLAKDPRARPAASELVRPLIRAARRLAGAPAAPPAASPVAGDRSETPTLDPVPGSAPGAGARRAARPRWRAGAGLVVAALASVAVAAQAPGGSGGRTGPAEGTGQAAAGGAAAAAGSLTPPTAFVELGAPVGAPDPAGPSPTTPAPPGPASPAGPAPAQPPPGPLGLVAVAPGALQLAEAGSFDRLGPWAAGLRARLPQASLAGVLRGASRAARPLCLRTSVPTPGFCWDQEDHDGARWFPAGVGAPVGVWARGEQAQAALAVAWTDRSGGAGLRVSFVQRDEGGQPRYEHVLLVEPTSTSAYRPVTVASGAGGIAWFEHILYVADGTGLRVFDLRQLLRAPGDDPATVGPGPDGRYHAAGYGYLLAQLGGYAPVGAEGCAGGAVCPVVVGLDASSTPAALLTVERGGPGTPARLARWELGADGRLAGAGGVAVATTAWRSDQAGLAGVAAHEGTVVTAGEEGGAGALWVQPPGAGPTRLAFPAGARGLALLPAAGQLWTATERPGARVVVAVAAAL